MANNGLESPLRKDTDLIRSAFRTSSDPTLSQFLVPAKSSHYLPAVLQLLQLWKLTVLVVAKTAAPTLHSLPTSLRA